MHEAKAKNSVFLLGAVVWEFDVAPDEFTVVIILVDVAPVVTVVFCP